MTRSRDNLTDVTLALLAIAFLAVAVALFVVVP